MRANTWLRHMWLQFEVLRGPVGVVWVSGPYREPGGAKGEEIE